MKFCLVTTFFPPEHFGGDAVVVAHQANVLAAAGHEVDVVCCAESYGLTGGRDASEMAIHPAVRVHRLRSVGGFLGPLSAHQTGLSRFRHGRLREILDGGFDVVHWHNISLVAGPEALAWARGLRVLTLHDYWFLCPTSILFRYDGAVCTAKRCVRCSIAHGRPPQLWRGTGMLQKACRHVDLSIAPSDFVRRKYLESGLPLRPFTLPHFVPPVPRFPKYESGYYFFAGRLSRYKGVQTLFPHFTGGSRQLWIAGTGPYEIELRAMAASNPNIRFLGRIPHGDLPELYAGARATLVPSICWETFGMTVLESLQQATPVIASNFGALPELIHQTGGGLIYETADELASALTHFESDPEMARRFGEQGCKQLERFTPERFLESYIRLIRPAAVPAGSR